MFKGSKIKEFIKFLQEGKSREEARDLAKIANTTSKIQYRKFIKNQKVKKDDSKK